MTLFEEVQLEIKKLKIKEQKENLEFLYSEYPDIVKGIKENIQAGYFEYQFTLDKKQEADRCCSALKQEGFNSSVTPYSELCPNNGHFFRSGYKLWVGYWL